MYGDAIWRELCMPLEASISSLLCWYSLLSWSDAVTCQWSWSTSVQVMAWCLQAPGHYLHQDWLLVSYILWYILSYIFWGSTLDVSHKICFIFPLFPGTNELTHTLWVCEPCHEITFHIYCEKYPIYMCYRSLHINLVDNIYIPAPSWTLLGTLSMKIIFYQYRDSHYKDETVSWQS